MHSKFKIEAVNGCEY